MTDFSLRFLVYVRGQEADPLVGDLIEERRNGRSALWVWKQVAMALWTGTWADAKQHPVLLLRAAMVALSLAVVWLVAIDVVARPWIAASGLRQLDPGWRGWGIPYGTAVFCIGLCSGWVIARTHLSIRLPAVVLAATPLTLLGLWRVLSVPSSSHLRWPSGVLTLAIIVAGLLIGGVLTPHASRRGQGVTPLP